MKKITPFLISVLFLWGCDTAPQQNEPKSVKTVHELTIVPNAEPSEAYKEIETDLMINSFDVTNYLEVINQEIVRLQKEGQVFWHDAAQKENAESKMQELLSDTECPGDKKENCRIAGVIMEKSKVPKNFRIGECEENQRAANYCLIIDPNLSAEFLKSLHSPQFFTDGKDIYTVDAANIVDEYTIYRNEDIFFSHPMYYGTEGAVVDAATVLDKPTFTFLEKMTIEDGNKVNATSNILFEGETLNEKYDLEGSSHLFAYKDKIGLVGQKEGKTFLFFNGQKISEDFDNITSHACCMAFEYPIQTDDKGILFFMAERGGKYYFVEVNLNEYL